MGVRFRKSIKLGKNTRLNLSKSGVGISTGVKGFRVSAGPKGVRTTASIPGTGISSTKHLSAKKKTKRIPVKGREIDGKIVMEVYGEKVCERPATGKIKPLTKRERKKGLKIAKRHQAQMRRAAAKGAKRKGCLLACIAVLGIVLLAAVIAAG